jgi:hypothetical protein
MYTSPPARFSGDGRMSQNAFGVGKGEIAIEALVAVHESLPGTSRHCAATQQFSRFRSKAASSRLYEYTA